MSVEIWEIAITIFLAGLGILLTWTVRKGWIDKELHEGILAVGHRAHDKWAAELKVARGVDSPGGEAITTAEMSQARQVAYDTLLKDLPSHVADYARRKGPDIIKGLIGRVMTKASDEDKPQLEAIPAVIGQVEGA